MCVDGGGATSASDFEGFKFSEFDGDSDQLTPSCPNNDFHIYDLSLKKRLIGFHVTISDYTGGRQNIRSIAAIVDAYPSCSVTVLDSLALTPRNMVAFIA